MLSMISDGLTVEEMVRASARVAFLKLCGMEGDRAIELAHALSWRYNIVNDETNTDATKRTHDYLRRRVKKAVGLRVMPKAASAIENITEPRGHGSEV